MAQPSQTFSQELAFLFDKGGIFYGLSNKEKLYLLGYFEKHDFNPGDVVIREGEVLRCLYIVCTGKWEIYLPHDSEDMPRPSEVHLNILEQNGDVLGEYAVLGEQPASASVRALTQGSLYAVDSQNFLNILQDNDVIGKTIYSNLLKRLIKRLRDCNDQIDLAHLTGVDF